MSPRSSKLSRPVPHPYSMAFMRAVSGTWLRIASATARARDTRTGSLSQPLACSSNSFIGFAEFRFWIVARVAGLLRGEFRNQSVFLNSPVYSDFNIRTLLKRCTNLSSRLSWTGLADSELIHSPLEAGSLQTEE